MKIGRDDYDSLPLSDFCEVSNTGYFVIRVRNIVADSQYFSGGNAVPLQHTKIVLITHYKRYAILFRFFINRRRYFRRDHHVRRDSGFEKFGCLERPARLPAGQNDDGIRGRRFFVDHEEVSHSPKHCGITEIRERDDQQQEV